MHTAIAFTNTLNSKTENVEKQRIEMLFMHYCINLADLNGSVRSYWS